MYISYHPGISDIWSLFIQIIVSLAFSDIFITFLASIYTSLSESRGKQEIETPTQIPSESRFLDQLTHEHTPEKIPETEILPKTEKPKTQKTTKKAPKKSRKK